MLEVGDGEGVIDGVGIFVADELGVISTDEKDMGLPHALIEK